MAGDRLITWSTKENALVTLVRTEHEGGQTILFDVEGDLSVVAGVPVPGQDLDVYWAKIKALVAAKVENPSVAWPLEVLVCPRDKSTSRAFTMRRATGPTLEAVLLPAERKALRLAWGRREFIAIGLLLCDLFEFTEREGFTQNDCHPGQYIVVTSGRRKKPEVIVRVDTPAFSFWHQQIYFGTDGARWEFVPPELQWLGGRPEGLKGHCMTREADRFALGTLLFTLLTGAGPTDYAGGDPDPAKRVAKKEFAVLSTPAGATVAPDVEIAFYKLPREVTSVLERALLGDPTKRPTPAEFRLALKSLTNVGGPWWAYGFTIIRTVLSTASRRLIRACRNNALWLVAAACIAAAYLLFHRGVKQQPSPPPAPAVTVQPPDDPIDIPPPTRRAKEMNPLQILNRKADK